MLANMNCLSHLVKSLIHYLKEGEGEGKNIDMYIKEREREKKRKRKKTRNISLNLLVELKEDSSRFSM